MNVLILVSDLAARKVQDHFLERVNSSGRSFVEKIKRQLILSRASFLRYSRAWKVRFHHECFNFEATLQLVFGSMWK